MEAIKTNCLSEDLALLTSKLMMTRTQQEIIALSVEFGQLLEKVVAIENNISVLPKENAVTAMIKFKKEEVSQMATTFKKEFIANGLVARVIKRQSGKKTFLYEIRYRRNGYNISVSSTDLATAKKKFLEATRPENITKYQALPKNSSKHLFREITLEWLEYKKGRIRPKTWSSYESYARRYLFPTLGDVPISLIRAIDVDKIMKKAEGRLYEDLRTVLNSVFKYAINSGLITHNPVSIIPFERAERETGRALTREEQIFFLQRLSLKEFAPYRQAFLVMYYFGLRPCELKDARFEGDFLIAHNAKHGTINKKVYKKIPIPAQAKEKLDTSAPITPPCNTNNSNDAFKRLMQNPDVKQYFLRHTFATTAQKYVRPDIVDIWMGDSPERLVGRVYTHFPDDFMIEQMNKVKFDI